MPKIVKKEVEAFLEKKSYQKNQRKGFFSISNQMERTTSGRSQLVDNNKVAEVWSKP